MLALSQSFLQPSRARTSSAPRVTRTVPILRGTGTGRRIPGACTGPFRPPRRLQRGSCAGMGRKLTQLPALAQRLNQPARAPTPAGPRVASTVRIDPARSHLAALAATDGACLPAKSQICRRQAIVLDRHLDSGHNLNDFLVPECRGLLLQCFDLLLNVFECFRHFGVPIAMRRRSHSALVDTCRSCYHIDKLPRTHDGHTTSNGSVYLHSLLVVVEVRDPEAVRPVCLDLPVGLV